MADPPHGQKLTHPDFGERAIIGPPWRLSATPASIQRPSPGVGEHTDDVLREVLDMSGAEISKLRARGALS